MSALPVKCPNCATPCDPQTQARCPNCARPFNFVVARTGSETLSMSMFSPEPPTPPSPAPEPEVPEAVAVAEEPMPSPFAEPPAPKPVVKAPSVPVIVLPQPEPEPANPFAVEELTATRRRAKVEEEDEEDEEEEDRRGRRRGAPAPAKRGGGSSGGKIVLLTCVGAILLVGVAVGGYYAFRDPPKEEVKRDPPPVVAPPKKDDKKKAQEPLTREQVVRRVKDSTVYIRVHLPGGSMASGSGFFAGKSGYVVTNAHVVGYGPLKIRKPEKVEVVVDFGGPSERTAVATIFGLDAELDLAVLRVELKNMPSPLPFGKAENLVETQPVIAFGYPLGESLGKDMSVNHTTVSSLRKKDGSVERVQLAGGLNPGNSGGPVTNANGEVIGVGVSGIRNADSIVFAIPAEVADRFVDDMHACNGEIRLGYLRFLTEPKGKGKDKDDPE